MHRVCTKRCERRQKRQRDAWGRWDGSAWAQGEDGPVALRNQTPSGLCGCPSGVLQNWCVPQTGWALRGPSLELAVHQEGHPWDRQQSRCSHPWNPSKPRQRSHQQPCAKSSAWPALAQTPQNIPHQRTLFTMWQLSCCVQSKVDISVWHTQNYYFIPNW